MFVKATNQTIDIYSLYLSNFPGAFFDKADANGYSLSDYMSFGSVTATCLVIIVNAQVNLSCYI